MSLIDDAWGLGTKIVTDLTKPVTNLLAPSPPPVQPQPPTQTPSGSNDGGAGYTPVIVNNTPSGSTYSPLLSPNTSNANYPTTTYGGGPIQYTSPPPVQTYNPPPPQILSPPSQSLTLTPLGVPLKTPPLPSGVNFTGDIGILSAASLTSAPKPQLSWDQVTAQPLDIPANLFQKPVIKPTEPYYDPGGFFGKSAYDWSKTVSENPLNPIPLVLTGIGIAKGDYKQQANPTGDILGALGAQYGAQKQRTANALTETWMKGGDVLGLGTFGGGGEMTELTRQKENALKEYNYNQQLGEYQRQTNSLTQNQDLLTAKSLDKLMGLEYQLGNKQLENEKRYLTTQKIGDTGESAYSAGEKFLNWQEGALKTATDWTDVLGPNLGPVTKGAIKMGVYTLNPYISPVTQVAPTTLPFVEMAVRDPAFVLSTAAKGLHYNPLEPYERSGAITQGLAAPATGSVSAFQSIMKGEQAKPEDLEALGSGAAMLFGPSLVKAGGAAASPVTSRIPIIEKLGIGDTYRTERIPTGRTTTAPEAGNWGELSTKPLKYIPGMDSLYKGLTGGDFKAVTGEAGPRPEYIDVKLKAPNPSISEGLKNAKYAITDQGFITDLLGFEKKPSPDLSKYTVAKGSPIIDELLGTSWNPLVASASPTPAGGSAKPTPEAPVFQELTSKKVSGQQNTVTELDRMIQSEINSIDRSTKPAGVSAQNNKLSEDYLDSLLSSEPQRVHRLEILDSTGYKSSKKVLISSPLDTTKGTGWSAGFSDKVKPIMDKLLPEDKKIIDTGLKTIQNLNEGKGTITSKTDLNFKPTVLNEKTNSVLLDEISKPEYKGKIVLTGSVSTLPSVNKGVIRDLGGSDYDILVKDIDTLNLLKNRLATRMRAEQPDLYVGSQPLAPNRFQIMQKGLQRSVVDAHTFSVFPEAAANTVKVKLPNGRTIERSNPEYMLKSKLGGLFKGIEYDPITDTSQLVYNRIKDAPDVVGLSRQASADTAGTKLIIDFENKRRNKLNAKSESYKETADTITDLLGIPDEITKSEIETTIQLPDKGTTQLIVAKKTINKLTNPLDNLEVGETLFNVKKSDLVKGAVITGAAAGAVIVGNELLSKDQKKKDELTNTLSILGIGAVGGVILHGKSKGTSGVAELEPAEIRALTKGTKLATEISVATKGKRLLETSFGATGEVLPPWGQSIGVTGKSYLHTHPQYSDTLATEVRNAVYDKKISGTTADRIINDLVQDEANSGNTLKWDPLWRRYIVERNTGENLLTDNQQMERNYKITKYGAQTKKLLTELTEKVSEDNPILRYSSIGDLLGYTLPGGKDVPQESQFTVTKGGTVSGILADRGVKEYEPGLTSKAINKLWNIGVTSDVIDTALLTPSLIGDVLKEARLNAIRNEAYRQAESNFKNKYLNQFEQEFMGINKDRIANQYNLGRLQDDKARYIEQRIDELSEDPAVVKDARTTIPPVAEELFLKQVSLETGIPFYKLKELSLTTGKGSWEKLTPEKGISGTDILKEQLRAAPSTIKQGYSEITDYIRMRQRRETPTIKTRQSSELEETNDLLGLGSPEKGVLSKPVDLGGFRGKSHKKKPDKRLVSDKQLDKTMDNILYGDQKTTKKSRIPVIPQHKSTSSNKQLDAKMNDIMFGSKMTFSHPKPKSIGNFGGKQKPIKNAPVYTSNKQLDKNMGDTLYGSQKVVKNQLKTDTHVYKYKKPSSSNKKQLDKIMDDVVYGSQEMSGNPTKHKPEKKHQTDRNNAAYTPLSKLAHW